MSGDGAGAGAGAMAGLEDLYELTPMQEGMLFDSLSASDSALYLIQLGYSLRGPLDPVHLRRAFEQVVARHAVLRTSFHWEGLEKPLQAVHDRVALPWEERDWTGLSADERRQRLEAFWEEDRARGVDFSAPPLTRITLVRTAPDAFLLIWTFHHILLEGWSASVVLEEVMAFYEAGLRGESLELEPPRPYRDYILWIQERDRSEVEAYWRENLGGIEVPTPLGIDRSPGSLYAPVSSYDGVALELSADETAALETVARRYRVTLNTLVQGAWALLLSRYSGDDDVLFGSIVSGRSVPLAGVESIVGLFINILPTRVTLPSDTSVLSWLKGLQERAVAQRQYEFSPLVEVKGWSDVPGGVPLFESILIFENWVGDISLEGWGGGLEAGEIVSRQGGPGYPIAVIAQPGPRLSFAISYDRDRFERDAIERMLGHLRTALEEIAEAPERSLSELSILTDAERRRLLVEWNDTRRDYPRDRCVHQLFEEQATRTPDATALVSGEARLTYDELNRRANQLADHLLRMGVGPDTRVGICVDRDPAMIVGVLGILKAGGAYVPLDPNYPAERIAYMLDDAGIEVLVTQDVWVDPLSGSGARLFVLDAAWERIADGSESNPVTEVTASDLAYVIYTSGSTGRPKGTMVSHANLVNAYRAWEEAYALRDSVRAHLQMASISFDVFAGDLVRGLCSGAKLVLVPQEILFSAERLYDLMRREEVDAAEFVPAVLRNLATHVRERGESLEFMRLLVAGSDTWYMSEYRRLEELVGPRTRLISSYGLTEATIDSTYFEGTELDLPGDSVVPIGRPFPNTELFVLDEALRPVPVGIPGELYVGGAGVARGYLNRPELTAERFVAHPFADEPEVRVYRTGDQVRYLPDGNLEFLGRIDHQVKLRGYRIELGEVEATLSRHPAIREAVAVIREDDLDDKRLVAYLVSAPEPCPAPGELRRFLLETLPEYMIPSAYVELEALPLTPNGKIDRRALPAPDRARPEMDEGFVEPRTSLEAAVAGIWAEILHVERVGVRDDFFDLGGHSLLAIQLVTRLRDTFRIDLPVRRLFESPTVAELSEALVAGESVPGQTERIARVLERIDAMSPEEVSGALDDSAARATPAEAR